MRVWVHAVRVTAAAAVATAPAVARAQQPPADVTARADALFHAAKQLRDAGQYADACPSFAESKRLAPGVGITLYLADCYEHIGRPASAWKEFREAEKLARERNDPRAEVARTRAEVLEPKLSGLTIVVPGAAGREAPEVLLDGTRIPPEEWNVAMAVDPGDHVVTVKARGQAPRTYTAHVDLGVRGLTVRTDDSDAVGGGGAGAVAAGAAVSGATTTAPLTAAAPATTSSALTAAPAAPVPDSSAATSGTGQSESAPPPGVDPGAAQRVGGLALLGAGLVGVGVGTVFLVKYESSVNPPASCTPPPPDTGSQIAAGVSYGLGGVALVSSLVLFLTAPHAHSKEASLLVMPAPIPGGGGAFLDGRF